MRLNRDLNTNLLIPTKHENATQVRVKTSKIKNQSQISKLDEWEPKWAKTHKSELQGLVESRNLNKYQGEQIIGKTIGHTKWEKKKA